MSVEEFRIGDLFDVQRGLSRYTRAYLESRKGTYPVFGASNRVPLGYMDQFDYEGPLITFATNGYGGMTRVIDGKFSLSSDRAVLKPKGFARKLSLPYMAHVVQSSLRPLAHGRRVPGMRNEYTKVSPEVALEATVHLPVNSAHDPDVERIFKLGQKLSAITHMQSRLREHKDTVESAVINLELNCKYAEISLGETDLFDVKIGKRVLQSDLSPDGFPVYSANVFRPLGYLNEVPTGEFEGDSLIWGIDGTFEWNLIRAHKRFHHTDHCGRLTVKSENIDSEYLWHELQSSRFRYGFNRVYRASLERIRDVSVRIPLNNSGRFDIVNQREIAAKRSRLEQAKLRLIDNLDNAQEAVISLA